MGRLILWLIITPDLHVLQLQPIYVISELFWRNDLTCIHFVYFDHQEATMVLDITIQFVASYGNKCSVAT